MSFLDVATTGNVVAIRRHPSAFIYVAIAVLAVLVVALVAYVCLRTKRAAAVTGEGNVAGCEDDDRVNRVLDFADEANEE